MCWGSLAAVFRSYKSCRFIKRHVKNKQSLAAGLVQEVRLSIGLSDNKKAAVQRVCFCCLMSYHPLSQNMQSPSICTKIKVQLSSTSLSMTAFSRRPASTHLLYFCEHFLNAFVFKFISQTRCCVDVLNICYLLLLLFAVFLLEFSSLKWSVFHRWVYFSNTQLQASTVNVLWTACGPIKCSEQQVPLRTEVRLWLSAGVMHIFHCNWRFYWD